MRPEPTIRDTAIAAKFIIEHERDEEAGVTTALAFLIAQARADERERCARAVEEPIYPDATPAERLVADATAKIFAMRIRAMATAPSGGPDT